MICRKRRKYWEDYFICTQIVTSRRSQARSVLYKASRFQFHILACGIDFIYSQEKCMQQQGDHYEIVDCKDNKTMVVAVNAKVTLNKTCLILKNTSERLHNFL
jgi:antirestriction protein